MNDDKAKKQKTDDDIQIERDADLDSSVVAEESFQETVKKLREKLKQCETEKNDYLTGWQRERADYANFKRDVEKDKKMLIRLGSERLFDDLIPALDSFDVAFGNKEAWEKVDKNWRQGVEYIYSHLVKALEGHGLIQYAPAAGEKLNHQKHEPVGVEPTDDQTKDQSVARVLKKGYLLSGDVFRPAQVIVFELKKSAD